MLKQFIEFTRATVVLVDQPRGAVLDDKCRVATWPVGNCSFNMNRNAQPITQIGHLTMTCANEIGKSQSC